MFLIYKLTCKQNESISESHLFHQIPVSDRRFVLTYVDGIIMDFFRDGKGIFLWILRGVLEQLDKD